MAAIADTDFAAGTESAVPITNEVLGNCLWCGHFLVFAAPGNPPGDCLTDGGPAFYSRSSVWRDFSLLDFPLQYGKFCPYAPVSPVGQFSVHQLVLNGQQP